MITATAVGRLVRDPELRYTPNGHAVCRFRLACDKPRDTDRPNFLDVITWNGYAELQADHLGKGRRVAASGELEHQQWQTNDGRWGERWELNARQVEWLDWPQTSNGNSNGPADPDTADPATTSDTTEPAAGPEGDATATADTSTATATGTGDEVAAKRTRKTTKAAKKPSRRQTTTTADSDSETDPANQPF